MHIEVDVVYQVHVGLAFPSIKGTIDIYALVLVLVLVLILVFGSLGGFLLDRILVPVGESSFVCFLVDSQLVVVILQQIIDF